MVNLKVIRVKAIKYKFKRKYKSKFNIITIAKVIKHINRMVSIGVGLLLLSSCGFHLRGVGLNNYSFPYKKVYLDCTQVIICQALTNTITRENLTNLVAEKESKEATIVINEEETSRTPINYNQYGRIASYLFTYQVTLQMFDEHNKELYPEVPIKVSRTMLYNDNLLLSAQTEEDKVWQELHDLALRAIIRQLVFLKPIIVSKDAAKFKSMDW